MTKAISSDELPDIHAYEVGNSQKGNNEVPSLERIAKANLAGAFFAKPFEFGFIRSPKPVWLIKRDEKDRQEQE